jgi:quercetin dioxygenase-like cupin family protein
MNSLKALLVAFQLLLSMTLILLSSPARSITHEDGSIKYEDITAYPIAFQGGNKTIIGQDFNYPTGTPLVKAFNIAFKPGNQTEIHKHAVPLYVYVVSGEMQVDYGSKGKKIFKAGDSYIEAMNWCHKAATYNNKSPAVIGIYLGQENPNQIKPESCSKLE